MNAGPRGSQPDAVSGADLYLFKATSRLRLTYQIRLLTYAAARQSGRLIIRTIPDCILSEDMASFVMSNREHVVVEPADR